MTDREPDCTPEGAEEVPSANACGRRWLPYAVLAAATLLVYASALGHSFLVNWDDPQYVTENPWIRGISWDHLRAAFSRFYIGNYAPLQIVSYMLDYEVWGLRASGFLLTNLLLHCANGLLFGALLQRLYRGRPWVFLGAALFLLHPVQVESVVWVSQRKNLLAMLFFLLSFHAYVSAPAEKKGGAAYWAALGAFGLGLLSKSVVVILPLALLLFDVCFRGQRLLAAAKRQLPFLALAVLFGVVALASHSAQVGGGRTPYHGGSLYATFLTMVPVLASYLGLVFWPTGLSAFYDVPVRTSIDGPVALAGLLCVVLIALGLILFRSRRDRFFWFALFFLGLLPVSQVVPLVTLMNDRYLYFPMLGGAALAASLLPDRFAWRSREGFAWWVAGAAAAACAALTLLRVPVWKDTVSLWEDAAKKTPGVALVHTGLGEGFTAQGRYGEAIGAFQEALRLGPQPGPHLDRLGPNVRRSVAEVHNSLGAVYGRMGAVEPAIQQFTAALKLDASFPKAYFNLGNAYMQKADLERALYCFEAAARLDPENPMVLGNLMGARRLLGERVKEPSARGLR